MVLLIWLSIKKMAEFLLVDSSDDFVQLVATRSSFGNMKKNEEKVGKEKRVREREMRGLGGLIFAISLKQISGARTRTFRWLLTAA